MGYGSRRVLQSKMSRIIEFLSKDEDIISCPYCKKRIAYTKEDIQVETTVECSYWGSEHWKRDYIICPNCGKKIASNWM